jgi:hypothetical protein
MLFRNMIEACHPVEMLLKAATENHPTLVATVGCIKRTA